MEKPTEKRTCNNLAICRFTWPGEEERSVCEAHAHQIKALADAIGCPLALIALGSHIRKCSQPIGEGSK